MTKHGKKHITTTKTYTMADGSTKEEVEETVEDAWNNILKTKNTKKKKNNNFYNKTHNH